MINFYATNYDSHAKSTPTNHNFVVPGVSASFSVGPLLPKLYWGPLFKFTFSGLYVPGAKV